MSSDASDTTDFLALLEDELSEVLADVRSIEAYIKWRRPKIEATRNRIAALKALLATYEGTQTNV